MLIVKFNDNPQEYLLIEEASCIIINIVIFNFNINYISPSLSGDETYFVRAYRGFHPCCRFPTDILYHKFTIRRTGDKPLIPVNLNPVERTTKLKKIYDFLNP